jgi:hypothetical protein
MSTSSRSKHNSKVPELLKGGDITSKTALQNIHQSNRPNTTFKDPPEAVVSTTTEAGTSTFFLLTLIQLC